MAGAGAAFCAGPLAGAGVFWPRPCFSRPYASPAHPLGRRRGSGSCTPPRRSARPPRLPPSASWRGAPLPPQVCGGTARACQAGRVRRFGARRRSRPTWPWYGLPRGWRANERRSRRRDRPRPDGERDARRRRRADSRGPLPRAARGGQALRARIMRALPPGDGKTGRPGTAKKPQALGSRTPAGRRASSPLPVARGGGGCSRVARGRGHDERPSLETAGPAALASAMGGAHTTESRRTTLGRRGGRRGGGSLCARLPDGGERPAPIAPRHGAAGETRSTHKR